MAAILNLTTGVVFLKSWSGTVTGGTLLLADGSSGAPSLSFANETNSGWYRQGASDIRLVIGGAAAILVQSSSSVILGQNTSTLSFGASADVGVTRVSAGVLRVAQSATTTSEWQVASGNGGFISTVKALTELTTIAAAATTSTAIQIPANAVVLGVSVRVVTTIPTAATFTVTSATPAKTWNTAAVTVASGSTDSGTAPGPTFQTTASSIVITPNLTPGAATGQVRVTIYYYAITPATS